MKRYWIILAFLLLPYAARAQNAAAFNGNCQKGGQAVVTQHQASAGTEPLPGIPPFSSGTGVMASYPRCQITVFLTGTTTVATIYKDIIGTPLANPFTGNSDGSFLFFAAVGIGYDVLLSGAGMPSPVTLTDVMIGGGGGGPPGITGATPNGGLVVTGTTLGLLTSCTSNQFLSWNGTAWVCTTPTPAGITGATPNGGLVQTGTTLGLLLTCLLNQSVVWNGTAWGCGSSGFTNPMTTLGDTIFGASGGIPTRLAGPTAPNGVPQLYASTPSGGVATAPNWLQAGVPGRSVSGTTDTILTTDCYPNRVQYVGSAAVAVTLPTATTLAIPACVFRIANHTTGSSTAVTVTPTTWTVNGNATLVIAQGQIATLYVDPGTATNWQADVTEEGITAGSGVTVTRGPTGLTIGATGSGGTITGSGTNNTVAKFTGATSIGNSSIGEDGVNPTRMPNGSNVAAAGGSSERANDSVNPTVLNKLVCDNGSGAMTECKAATSTTNVPLGVCIGGCGTTGSAIVCSSYNCSVIFDNTATAKHWCISSSTVDGDCHDNGSTVETDAQPNIFILAANSGAGTAGTVGFTTPDSRSKNATCPTCITSAAALTNHGVVLGQGTRAVVATAAGSSGQVLTSNGSSADPTYQGIPRAISFTIGDPAGAALTTGATTTDYLTIPFACTIQAWNLEITAGTITVKFWKIATGTAIPTASNSINTSGVSIASGTAIHSTTLTDFTTTTIAANDIMAMNVTAVATTPFVNGVIQCQ